MDMVEKVARALWDEQYPDGTSWDDWAEQIAPQLSIQIRNYHGLAVDFAAKQGTQAFIHSSRNGMRRV